MNSNSKKNNKRLTIGGLAEVCDVGVSTVRYYQKLGLMSEPEKPLLGGFRMYDEQDVEQLLQIINAKAFGFSLKQIGLVFSFRKGHDCQSVRALITEREQAVKSQIRTLEKTRKSLIKLSESCTGRCRDGKCPLFENLGMKNLRRIE